jgi:hypothetical protein
VCAGACAARHACGWCPTVGVGVPPHHRHWAVGSPSIPAATAVVRLARTLNRTNASCTDQPGLCHPIPGWRPQLRRGDRSWSQGSPFPPNGGGTGAPKPPSLVVVHRRRCHRPGRRGRGCRGGRPGRSFQAREQASSLRPCQADADGLSDRPTASLTRRRRCNDFQPCTTHHHAPPRPALQQLAHASCAEERPTAPQAASNPRADLDGGGQPLPTVCQRAERVAACPAASSRSSGSVLRPRWPPSIRRPCPTGPVTLATTSRSTPASRRT